MFDSRDSNNVIIINVQSNKGKLLMGRNGKLQTLLRDLSRIIELNGPLNISPAPVEEPSPFTPHAHDLLHAFELKRQVLKINDVC